MSTRATHYVVIGQRFTWEELNETKPGWQDGLDLWDSEEIISIDPMAGKLGYILVDEIIQKDEYGVDWINLKELAIKHPIEKIHIFTQWS